jgi:hypothetical protein
LIINENQKLEGFVSKQELEEITKWFIWVLVNILNGIQVRSKRS